MTEDRTPATASGFSLTYIDETAIVFANNTYQFIVLREFGLPAGESLTDRDVLTALIANRQYRGSFVGTGDGDDTIHHPPTESEPLDAPITLPYGSEMVSRPYSTVRRSCRR